MLGVNILSHQALAVGDPVNATPLAGIVTHYLSDRGWISAPTDPLPHQPYLPRLSVPLVVERNLPLAPEATRRLALSSGEIVVLNTDGYFDAITTTQAVDGRRITVKAGRPDAAYQDFITLFSGTGTGWQLADDGTVRIGIRDITWRLEAPAQANLYGGSGGLDGGEDLKGKPKPMTFGTCLNIPALLIDPVRLIYQFHDGPIKAVSGIYDRGVPLTYAGNVADILAASPAAGTYVTQISGGYARLGSPPAGMVTADVLGDWTNGVFAETASDIVRHLVKTRGNFTEAELDGYSFDFLKNTQPAPLGITVGIESLPLSEILDRVMQGIGGWWGGTRQGKLAVGRITAPAQLATLSLSPVEILDLERIDAPPSIHPPNYRRQVGYARNWTVQQSDLAASVSPERRLWLAEATRLATAEDHALRQKFLLATDPGPVPALFLYQADADAEAARLLALFKVERFLFRLTVKLSGYLIELGDTIRLIWPRYGLSAGKNGVVVGQRIDADRNAVTLTVLI